MVSLQIAHNSKRYCESCIFRNINKVIERLNFNNIFKWAFVPGWTINEFPAFAKLLDRVAGNF